MSKLLSLLAIAVATTAFSALLNPKSSAQQVETQPAIVQLVDNLLDDYTE